MNSRLKFRLIAAFLPALLVGCMTESDNGPATVLPMEALSGIKGAKAAAVVDGKLYVANRDSAATGIAVVDLATDKVVAFHKETLPPNDILALGDSVLVISETDYSNGSMSRLNVKTGKWEPSYKAVAPDNALTAAGGDVFLMERTLGSVTGFRNGTLAEGNVFLNVQTGAKANPYQTAIHGKTAFVTRYGRASLLVLEADKKDGGTPDSIDLSGFVADSLKGAPGAVPNMDAAVIYGKRLFVTVQRLTGWAAKDTSKVVVIDVESRKVTGSISLKRKNPTSVSVRGKYLFVACVDGYGTFTGAVERIDMEKEEHAGLVVEEANLAPPSDLTQFVPVSDTKGYTIHTPDFKTSYISATAIP